MPYLPLELSRALDSNELTVALARDATEPFREETRKARRNLVAASFIGIALSSLDLKISSFSGVTFGAGPDSGDIVQGLVSLATIYFLVAYVADAALDYLSWRLSIVRLTILPYLALVSAVHRSFRTSRDQFKNVVWSLNYHKPGSVVGPETSPISLKNVEQAIGQVGAIAKTQEDMYGEISPLLSKWDLSLRRLKAQANVRQSTRWVRMWVWDTALPITIALLCIWKTHGGLSAVVPKLMTIV